MPEEVAAKKAFYNFTLQDPRNTQREGVSVFYQDDYQYLDLVPKGRDENGRGPFWVRRHDEYGQ